MDRLKFIEKSLLGGWKIEVRKGTKHIGNIRKNPSNGSFQYFRGCNNELTPFFEEKNLDTLKERIEG